MDDNMERGEGWKRAFLELAGQDSTPMSQEEIMRKLRERLQNDLHVTGVEDVEQAAGKARSAILEIVRKESSFTWSVFTVLPWRDALAEYLKVAAEVAKLPTDRRIEAIDDQLNLRKREIGNLLRSAAGTVVPREHLEKRLKEQGISTDTDRMTRFLVSELNAELEWPRVIGIISIYGPHYKPHYVALPDMVGYPSEFLTVCRLFDH